MRFVDRHEAGRLLGSKLADLSLDRPVILALPGGGVPVAVEVAAALGAPLDVLVVRKLGHPHQPELGVGAIAEGGTSVVNERLAEQLGLSREALADVVRRQQVELDRRVARYRGGRSATSLVGRTVVLVDDGLATGYTAWAAIAAVRSAGAGVVVLAVPVAPSDSLASLRTAADDIVCLQTPPGFLAVGEYYEDFRQVGDEEVVRLLADATGAATATATAAATAQPSPALRDEPAVSALTRQVRIPSGQRRLPGAVTVPGRASGIVVFAHGSGSSMRSPRNLAVARVLDRSGLGTMLFDLLTPSESAEQGKGKVADVEQLARRLVDAVGWIRGQPTTAKLPIGLFGASTGAAAALAAAAELAGDVQAVVSRGGRPDLAGSWLEDVHCPTLLVVGGSDDTVLELNRLAARRLPCEHELLVVPGASHLFEEPGTLAVVATEAARWFRSVFDRARVAR